MSEWVIVFNVVYQQFRIKWSYEKFVYHDKDEKNIFFISLICIICLYEYWFPHKSYDLIPVSMTEFKLKTWYVLKHRFIVIVLYIYIYLSENNVAMVNSEWVKVALRPSNAKRLYTDKKSTETGEIKIKNRKAKWRKK